MTEQYHKTQTQPGKTCWRTHLLTLLMQTHPKQTHTCASLAHLLQTCNRQGIFHQAQNSAAGSPSCSLSISASTLPCAPCPLQRLSPVVLCLQEHDCDLRLQRQTQRELEREGGSERGKRERGGREREGGEARERGEERERERQRLSSITHPSCTFVPHCWLLACLVHFTERICAAVR